MISIFNIKPISDSQNDAIKKYRDSGFDRLEVLVPKGDRKLIKDHAKKYQLQIGEPGKVGYSPKGSVTAFVNRAIKEAMERDANNNGDIPKMQKTKE